MAEQDDGFLSRWSRRKTQVRRGDVPAEPAASVVHDRSGTPPLGPRPVAMPVPAPGAAAAVLP
ncbi:MAG: DUF3306 domain-containing protein, partial [Rhodoferax sp.]|nr:DUF3306 domain-containing protein [Rhodoferax sp.]